MPRPGESVKEFQDRALEHMRECGSKGILPLNNIGTVYQCTKCKNNGMRLGRNN